MEEPDDDLEPLFDYSRVQPLDFVCLDEEEDWALSPIFSESKRLKKSTPSASVASVFVGNLRNRIWYGFLVRCGLSREKSCEVVNVDEDEGGGRGNKEEDWLPPPPPKMPNSGSGFAEDETLQELRDHDPLALLVTGIGYTLGRPGRPPIFTRDTDANALEFTQVD